MTELEGMANYIADTWFEWDDAEDEARQKALLLGLLKKVYDDAYWQGHADATEFNES